MESHAGIPNHEDQIVRLCWTKKISVPANVPELLRLLRLPPNRQQVLQGTLRELEQTGRVARIKGTVTSSRARRI